jgi:hypothetical protein
VAASTQGLKDPHLKAGTFVPVVTDEGGRKVMELEIIPASEIKPRKAGEKGERHAGARNPVSYETRFSARRIHTPFTKLRRPVSLAIPPHHCLADVRPDG